MEIVGWFTINQILKVSQVSGDFTQFKWIQDSCFLHNVQLTSSLGRGWILLPFPSAFDWRLGIMIHTYIHTYNCEQRQNEPQKQSYKYESLYQ